MALGDLGACESKQEHEIRSMSKNENAISDDISINIDQKLIEEGTAQLSSEIKVLEAWLNELDSSEDSDTEIIAARKSYNDMLRSRKEMRTTLTKQAKLQAITTS
jgi:hypothetical protein